MIRSPAPSDALQRIRMSFLGDAGPRSAFVRRASVIRSSRGGDQRNSGASTSVIVLSSLIEHVQRRTRRVLERIADRVADDRRLVRLGALAAVRAGLDVLLGVVPGAAAVVQEARHQDAGDRADHQQRRDRLGAHELARPAEVLEEQADDDREEHDERAGQRPSPSARRP